jgi:ATP-dependent DNA ligase
VLLSACRMDLEGIVSKRLDAPYRSGRGETWTKSKCRAGHEVVIGGYTTTDGAFRSLIAGVIATASFPCRPDRHRLWPRQGGERCCRG